MGIHLGQHHDSPFSKHHKKANTPFNFLRIIQGSMMFLRITSTPWGKNKNWTSIGTFSSCFILLTQQHFLNSRMFLKWRVGGGEPPDLFWGLSYLLIHFYSMNFTHVTSNLLPILSPRNISVFKAVFRIRIWIRWIRKICASWIRIRKNMQIHGQNINRKLQTKIFCSQSPSLNYKKKDV